MAGTGDTTAADGEWNDNSNTGGANNSNNNGELRDKSRLRGNARIGRGGSDSRGWRGRESRENDRNAGGDNRTDKWQNQNNQNRRGGPAGSFRNGGFTSGRGGRGG